MLNLPVVISTRVRCIYVDLVIAAQWQVCLLGRDIRVNPNKHYLLNSIFITKM